MSKWHPYPQEKPKVGSQYLITVVTDDGEPYITTDEFSSFESKDYVTYDNWLNWMYWGDAVTAWAELPKPYKGKE